MIFIVFVVHTNSSFFILYFYCYSLITIINQFLYFFLSTIQITKNPSYYNTFRGWDDELHNNAWNAFNKSPEDFYMFCKNNGVNVEQSLGEAITKGYPLPWFFVLDGEENEISSVENKLEDSNSIDIVKVAVNNRKKLENWTDEDIIHDDLQFDYLILGNHNGWRQFNKDYTEVKLFSEEEIESLDMGHNIRKKI